MSSISLIGLSPFLFATLASSDNAGKRKLTWLCTPKKPGTAKESVDEFWEEHYDKVAFQLNEIFIEMGWLVSVKSELTEDKKSAILTKVYKNERLAGVYFQLWESLSNWETAEARSLIHTPYDKHLS